MPRKLTKSFLQAYLDYTSETEAPRQYNLWCGIAAISSSLKRKVYVQHGHYKIYASNYIVLVGPPGVGKGTAINPAADLVKKAGTANIIEGRITVEKLIDRLATGFMSSFATTGTGVVPVKDTSATVIATELPIFLGASDWMLPYLCEMWDRNEFPYDTKGKGTFVIKDICMGILGGCVPDFIRKINRDATSSVTGGFTSRCIFVYANEKFRKNAWPDATIAKKIEDDLVEDLRAISQLQGEFRFTLEAQKLWKTYYDKLDNDPFEAEVISNFRARMKSHIFKCAMALTASESDNLIIDKNHLFNAIELIEDVRDKLDITFRSVGESPLAAAQDRIMKFIEAKGLVSRSEILKYNYRHITDEDLSRVLLVLTHSGFCCEEMQGNKVVYRHLGKKKTITQPKGVP